MQFPESWLREFCNPPLSTSQLAETLTMGGFEVEELRPVAPPFTQVVVAEIVRADPHPNADRLRVCQVNVGQGDLLGIVCGAPNARPGIKVPCALVGAQLPSDGSAAPITIKQGKLRGVVSQGMLCSARELGLSADHAGLLELPAALAVGQDLRIALDLDDTVFTLKLTPNLGHVLSVYGVARELSALTGAPLKTPVHPSVPTSTPDTLAVRVSAPDLCGRFSGRVIRHVDTRAATPSWMVDRLARCGQRSVTALVDISNYVLFEYGRPTHIFDLDKIHGGLDVRWGRSGETLKLLNGNTVALDDSVGVIADDREVESLAGIMGGDATAVSDTTHNIYVEAAFWWPEAVAGRSRRYNFATEAGYRFERGVDPGLTIAHIERISQLIVDICGTSDTVCGPIDDQQPNLPEWAPVTLRVDRAAKVIGIPITQVQCADVFTRLGLDFTQGEGTVTVTPPTWRFDLRIEEDLIEEVVRVIGYQNLPEGAPLSQVLPRTRPESRRSAFDVRHALAGLGYLETINFSFVDEAWERDLAANTDPIRLLNPIASQMRVMRSTLLGSLLDAVKYNADRRASRIRLFEIGRVFRRDVDVETGDRCVKGVAQPQHVAGVIFGPPRQQNWEGSDRPADFFDVKGDVEVLLSPRIAAFERAEHPAFHPGRCARVLLDGRTVGHLGELHPSWRQNWELAQAPMMFELELEAVLQRPLPQVQPVARQLPVDRDIAVVVSERVTHEQLMHCVREAAIGGLLRDANLFDIYRPKAVGASTGGLAVGEKSMALRLVLGSESGENLTDERIEEAVASIVSRLRADLGARLRG